MILLKFFYLRIFGCCMFAVYGLAQDSQDRLVVRLYMFVYKVEIRLRKFYCILDIPNLPILHQRIYHFRKYQYQFQYPYRKNVVSDALHYHRLQYSQSM